jgi:folate-binding protein YgfZ
MAEKTPLHEAAAQAGAVFADDAGWLVPAHFGAAGAEYARARAGAVLLDQSHRGKVELTGADAVSFLHNLCTNDVRNLAPGAGCEAFLTNVKAKVVAHALVYRQGEGGAPALWLDLAPNMATKVIQHLDHFLISEQVEFADRSAEFAQVQLAGPQALAVLETAGEGAVPALAPLGHLARTLGGAACQVRRHDPLGVPGYDILCRADEAGGLWRLLAGAGASPAGLEAYETLRIEAGTPRYGVDIDDDTFAPEVGRTPQAICYTKGCYLGQEPVVMARDRGHVNRTLRAVLLPGGPVPRGSRLYRDGKEVGRVTSSAVSPRLAAAVGLAYLRRGSQEPGTAVEVEVEGQRRPAEVVTLPVGPPATATG